MAKNMLLLWYCLCSYAVWGMAQESNGLVYFNKTYGGNDTCNMLCQVAYPLADGFLTMGGYATDDFGHTLYIMKTDQQGEFVWLKHLVQGDTWGVIEDGKWLCATNDGNFVLTIVEALLPLGTGSTIHLFKFNTNGDTIWHRIYNNEHSQLARHVIQTSDDGFALAGFRYYEGGVADTARCLLIKTDTAGYIQWQRTYSMGNDARAFSVHQTPWDGGYILGCWGYSPTMGYDMLVVKTNSVGDSLWAKRYGGVFWDCGAQIVPLTSMQEFQMGQPIRYLLSGCFYTSDDWWDSNIYLAKLNGTGGIVWQITHTNYDQLGDIQTPLIIRSGKRLIGGTYFVNDNGKTHPLIIAFNADGTIEWSKPITINPEKSCYIKDMRPTDDGGYVLAGYQYDTPQTAWVLKIDSLGNTCSFVGCDSTVYVGIQTIPPYQGGQGGGFTVYPNPAQDYIVVENHSQEQSATFALYDVVGRRVLSAVSHHQSVVSIEHLPSGVYLYQFINPQNQILTYGKVSVLR